MRVSKAIEYNKKREYSESVVKKIQATVGADPDGIWGPETVAKVADWQESKGLSGDGMVGPSTYSEMAEEWDDAPTDCTRDRKAFNEAASKNPDETFLCPILWKTLDLRSEEGILWTSHIQKAFGLKVDGIFGPNTRKKFERRYGPLTMDKITPHPLPLMVWRWGYDHGHDWDDTRWPFRDKEWEKVTSGGDWEDGMVRLVSGYDSRNGTTSRPGRSYITLDVASISFSHEWSKAIPEFLADLMKMIPDLMEEAFGKDIAAKLRDPKWMRKEVPWARGKEGRVPHTPNKNWLAAGWWWLGDHEEALPATKKLWLSQYAVGGRRMAEDFGWGDDLRGCNGGRILAATTRLANSGVGSGRRRIRAGIKKCGSRDPMKALETTYRLSRKEGGYGHADRWDHRIIPWDEFEGPAPEKWL